MTFGRGRSSRRMPRCLEAPEVFGRRGRSSRRARVKRNSNDECRNSNVERSSKVKARMPAIRHLLFVIRHSLEAGLGAFGFADGSVGVVDEVVDLVEAAEEHGVAVDDDVVELG